MHSGVAWDAHTEHAAALVGAAVGEAEVAVVEELPDGVGERRLVLLVVVPGAADHVERAVCAWHVSCVFG